MPAISAVIITYNEERNIERCIKSVLSVADEVLVVDSFSNDRTVAIASELGARVIQEEFRGYREQKNFAAASASFDCILSLDADEAISPELQQSILEIKETLHNRGYSMNRLTNYCGQWIRHSGWYPDVKIRLFDRNVSEWKGTNPHDRLEVAEGVPVRHLKGDILHYSYYTVEEHKAQIRKFTDISSRAHFENGKRAHWWNLAFNPVSKFMKNYIFRCGFLDGYYGWLICSYSAYATFLKYRKLLKIQNNTP